MKILDEERRNAMFVIYEFCKKADTIADRKEIKKNKEKKINKLKKNINEIFNDNLNNNFDKNLKFYINKYKLDKKYFMDIIKGVEMDIDNMMICPNKNTFDLYCYRVAGAVGLISLKIFGAYNKKTKSFGLYLAKAFQITNILRDIKEDKGMGRMYVPKEILNAVGIKSKKITLVIKDKKFPKACEKLAEIADSNFNKADKALKSCSKKELKSAILMMNTYKSLLKKLKKKGWENLDKRVNLTKAEKIFLFLKGNLLIV